MKGKSIIGLSVILTLAVSLFAGCGGSKTTADTSASSTTQSSAVTQTTTAAQTTEAQKATIAGMAQNGMWNKGMDAVIAAAEAQIGVKVEMQILPDGSQGEQVIKTKYASNDVPDLLFYWSGATVVPLNPEKNFLDISKEAWVSNIPEVLKAPLSYKGVLYGAPLASSGINLGGVFYNKKVFSDLKLEVPKTYSEFLAVCDKIKATGKITPIFYSCKDAWSAQIIPNLCFPYIERDDTALSDKLSTNKLKFADIPAFVTSFDKLKEFKDKGYINKDYLAATYDNAQKALVDGTAAMYPNGTWMMGAIAGKFPDQIENIGAFAFPNPNADGELCVNVWASAGAYINSSSKNPEAAKKWMAFYTSPEGASEYYKVIKDIPVFNGVTSEMYGATADLNKYMVDGKSGLDVKNIVPFELVDFDKICVEVLVSGKSSLDEVKQVDANCQKDAKSKGIAGF